MKLILNGGKIQYYFSQHKILKYIIKHKKAFFSLFFDRNNTKNAFYRKKSYFCAS